MIIPTSELAPKILQAIIEEFITREGTDYGEQELTLTEKVERLKPKLAAGEVLVVFDPETEQVTLINERDLPDALPG